MSGGGMLQEEDTKVCPNCAETIKAAAVTCRFCGHSFTSGKKASDRQARLRGAAAITTAAGLLMVLGSFLDWVSLTVGFQTFSRNGLEISGTGFSDGVATLALGVLTLIIGLGVFFLFRLPRFVQGSPIVTGLLVVATAIYDVVHIGNRIDLVRAQHPSVSGSVGAGVWVVLVGGILAVLGGLIAAMAKREPKPKNPKVMSDEGLGPIR